MGVYNGSYILKFNRRGKNSSHQHERRVHAVRGSPFLPFGPSPRVGLLCSSCRWSELLQTRYFAVRWR